MTPTNGRKPRLPDDTFVRVKYRKGEISVVQVGKRFWGHNRPGFPKDWDFDIIEVERLK